MKTSLSMHSDVTLAVLKTFADVGLAVVIGTILATNPAFAGGLDSATQAATTFKTWFYSFAGILAICYLLYKGMEAWTDRAQWSDFGIAVGKVAAVGSVVVVAPWAWSLFVN